MKIPPNTLFSALDNTMIIIIIVKCISKAPTLRFKTLNKHNKTHTTCIEIETDIKLTVHLTRLKIQYTETVSLHTSLC